MVYVRMMLECLVGLHVPVCSAYTAAAEVRAR